MIHLNENNEKEIYKDVIGYEGLYEVSNMGNIRDVKTRSLLKYTINRVFNTVNLFDIKYKTKRVHLLVAEAFLEPVTENLSYVNKHIDGNGLNDKANNLKWITNGDNQIKQYVYPTQIASIDINTEFIYVNNTHIHVQTFDINKEIEHFVPIKGYESRYLISNLGNVWSLISNMQMAPHERGGYHVVGFRKEDSNISNKIKKEFSVHRLVATHFIPNDDDTKNVIDHIDNNKKNNRYDNLRWSSLSDNTKSYMRNHKPKIIDVVLQYDLNKVFIKRWNHISEIVAENKTYTRSALSLCLCGKNKTAYGFIWEYENKNRCYIPELKKDEIFKNVGTIGDRDYSLYEVSNYGTLRNAQTQQYLRLAIGSNGYYVAVFTDVTSKKCHSIKVHRIVAQVFLDKPIDKNYVNHINENKLDNAVTNLEWMTNRENSIYTNGKRINMHDIKTNEIIKTFKSVSEASEHIKCVNGSVGIGKCCNEPTKVFYGYRWSYADDEDKHKQWFQIFDRIKRFIDENKSNLNTSTKSTEYIRTMYSWLDKQESLSKKRENEMKSDEIFNKWTEFIESNKDYKKYFKQKTITVKDIPIKNAQINL